MYFLGTRGTFAQKFCLTVFFASAFLFFPCLFCSCPGMAGLSSFLLVSVVLTTLLSACEAKPSRSHSKLPSCGNCYSGVNDIYFTCSDCIISTNNGGCVCGDGSPCTQCSLALQGSDRTRGKQVHNSQSIHDSPYAFGVKVGPPSSVGGVRPHTKVNKGNSSSALFSGYLNVSMTAFNGDYYHQIVLLETDQYVSCGNSVGHNGDPSASHSSGLFWNTPLCNFGSLLSFSFGGIIFQPQNNQRAYDWIPLSFQINDQNTYSLNIQGYSYDVTKGQFLNLDSSFNNCEGYYWNVNGYMGFNWFLCYQ